MGKDVPVETALGFTVGIAEGNTVDTALGATVGVAKGSDGTAVGCFVGGFDAADTLEL